MIVLIASVLRASSNGRRASPCEADVGLLTQADTRPQKQGSMLLSLDPYEQRTQ